MARPTSHSQMTVQIVDPSEVSQIIQLEPSSGMIPRPATAAGEPRAVSVAAPTVPGHRGTSTGAPVVAAQRFPDAQSAPRGASGSADAVAPAYAAPAGATGSVPAVSQAPSSPVDDVPSVYDEALLSRKIAVSVHAAIRASGSRTILLTSPNARAGRTTVAELLRRELQAIDPGRYIVVHHTLLAEYDPERRPDGAIVIVDGPAMLDGEGLLPLPLRWMNAFDGAILVVLGRRTPSEDLTDAVKWLDDARVRVIGVVFNELCAPDPTVRLSVWRRLWRTGTWKSALKEALRPRKTPTGA